MRTQRPSVERPAPGVAPRIADRRRRVSRPRRRVECGGNVVLGEPVLEPTPVFVGLGRRCGVAGDRPAVSPTRSVSKGPFLEDGTLVKPVAVNTTVADGRSLVRSYTVKAGDDLDGDRASSSASRRRPSGGPTISSRRMTSRPARSSAIPPANGAHRDGRRRPTRSTTSPAATRSRPRRSSRPTRSTTRTSSSVRSWSLPGAAEQAHPDAEADPFADPTLTAGRRHQGRVQRAGGQGRQGREGAGKGRECARLLVAVRRSRRRSYSRRRLRVARRRRQELRQPVLPLRPFRHRHRGDFGSKVRLPRVPGSSRSRAGRATAAVIRSGSPTGRTCSRPTTTCRRSPSASGSRSTRASRSAARPEWIRDRSASSLRGVARGDLGWRPAAQSAGVRRTQ